jgi:hypothetical protein
VRRYGHGYPFFPRAWFHVVALPVTPPAVAVRLRDGVDASLPAVEPLYAVFFGRIQSGRHLWGHQARYLLETVRPVEVVGDQPPQDAIVPQRSTLRSRYPFGVQARLYSPDSDAICYKVENLLYHPYLRLVDEQTIAGFVEAEAVRGRRPADHASLASLPELSPAGTLRYLCLFVLRQLVEDAVRKFASGVLMSRSEHHAKESCY